MPKVFLTPKDIALMEKQATNVRDRLLLRLIFQTGCRISEALKMGTLDFQAPEIKIIHTTGLTTFHHECGQGVKFPYEYCPRCGKKIGIPLHEKKMQTLVRRVPLEKNTSDLLQRYISGGGPVNNRLFPINRHRAWQIIRQLAIKAGLPKIFNIETEKYHNICPEHLREAFIIQCLKEGEDLLTIKRNLGLTSQNYKRLVRLAGYRDFQGVPLKVAELE